MSKHMIDASLQFVGLQEDTSVYELLSRQFSNRYFIISHAGTRRLMAFPEVVGYDSYLSMLPPTVAALRHLFPQGQGGDVDILTILRGGLNYPLEEACHRNGIRVRDIHFVSCERIIEDHVITGLEIKYEKLRVKKDCTLVIGDIIATGDTLRLCLDQVIDRFRRRGGSIRKIIFFTIGGTRAIDLMEQKTAEIRAIFPEFEGFECFFYEGIFSVYENAGATGINVPDIDFGWMGGIVSPDFRRYVMEHWGRADRIDPAKLVGEKLGYGQPLSYAEWLKVTGFRDLMDETLKRLWTSETELLENAGALSLENIATQRIQAINSILKQYE